MGIARWAARAALMLHLGCAVDDGEPAAEPEAGAETADAAVAAYQRAMCIDDFRAANMTTAWVNTTMYPHEAAVCAACHGGGRSGFFAPRLDVFDATERERQFFVGLRADRANLAGYVVAVAGDDGGYAVAINRRGLEAIAAGASGHEKFVLDSQPGPGALQTFHALTLQRLASGAGCATLQ